MKIERDPYNWGGPTYPAYDGFLDRGQAKKVSNQALQNSQQDQGNAQTALGQENAAVQGQQDATRRFMNFGRRTYGANGDFMRSANTLATTAAAAGARATEGDMALNAMRTGASTANYAPALAKSRMMRQQDMTSQLAKSNQDRLSALTGIEKTGLDASQFPAQMYQGMYGAGMGGANSQIGVAGDTSKVPSGWDVFGQDLAAAGGAAIGAFCPCAGAMVTLSDGGKRPVEKLRKGDKLLGMGGQINEVMEDPEPHIAPSFHVRTVSGADHRGSDTHAIVLAVGGYAPLPELLGQMVVTDEAASTVNVVSAIGRQPVYPLKINGNRTYLVDKLWALA